MIKKYMEPRGVKAGQFSLIVDGLPTMSSAYTWGEPDYAKTKPDSVMRVASCSKAFTTAAILDLLDPPQGAPLLRADDKVLDILLPDSDTAYPQPIDPRVKDITVKHLLEHTGGWNYRTGPGPLMDWVFHLKFIGRYYQLDRPAGKKEFARYILRNIRLDFDPGTRPDDLFALPNQRKKMDTYSNIGYVLLGMIVDAKAGAFVDHLNGRILQPIGIDDVAVGNTRQDQALPSEVSYESRNSGPDATRNPFDPSPAPYPYGGDGSLKEVMDSGGGLVMSANSLAKFIGRNNVYLTDLDPDNIGPSKGRINSGRNGSMPGTQATGRCFEEKSKRYDMAVIFNMQDTSKTDADGSSDFDRLIRRLEEKVKQVF